MSDYPDDWPAISKATKDAAGWKCIRCEHAHCRKTWHVLTVHHLDGIKSNCRWWNLAALCQRCHLSIQGRVKMNTPWFLEHTAWMKPYAAGFYAFKYQGRDLTREEVMAELDSLLALERKD